MRWREVQPNLANEAQVGQYGDQRVNVLLGNATVCDPPGMGASGKMDPRCVGKLLRRAKIARWRHRAGEKREPKFLCLLCYLRCVCVEVKVHVGVEESHRMPPPLAALLSSSPVSDKITSPAII